MPALSRSRRRRWVKLPRPHQRTPSRTAGFLSFTSTRLTRLARNLPFKTTMPRWTLYGPGPSTPSVGARCPTAAKPEPTARSSTTRKRCAPRPLPRGGCAPRSERRRVRHGARVSTDGIAGVKPVHATPTAADHPHRDRMRRLTFTYQSVNEPASSDAPRGRPGVRPCSPGARGARRLPIEPRSRPRCFRAARTTGCGASHRSGGIVARRRDPPRRRGRPGGAGADPVAAPGPFAGWGDDPARASRRVSPEYPPVSAAMLRVVQAPPPRRCRAARNGREGAGGPPHPHPRLRPHRPGASRTATRPMDASDGHVVQAHAEAAAEWPRPPFPSRGRRCETGLGAAPLASRIGGPSPPSAHDPPRGTAARDIVSKSAPGDWALRQKPVTGRTRTPTPPALSRLAPAATRDGGHRGRFRTNDAAEG